MGSIETVKVPAVPEWDQYYKEAESYWAGDTESGPKTASGFYGWTGIGSSGTENYYQFGELVRNTEYQGIKTNVGTDDVLRMTLVFKGDGSSTPFLFFKISDSEQKEINITENIGGMHNPYPGLKGSFVNIRTYPNETTIETSSHSAKALASTATIEINGEEVPWLEATPEQRGITYLEVMDSGGTYVKGIYPPDVWFTGSIYTVRCAILLADFYL